MNARIECADCGPVAVSHRAERLSIELDYFIDYFSRPLDALWQAVRPFIAVLEPGRLAPSILNILAALGLGRIMEHPDEENTWRARVLREEANHRGILMREFRPFGLPRELFYATLGDDTRFFDGLPRPRNAPEAALNWMDDKGIILSKFKKAGIPVPQGGSARSPGL